MIKLELTEREFQLVAGGLLELREKKHKDYGTEDERYNEVNNLFIKVIEEHGGVGV